MIQSNIWQQNTEKELTAFLDESGATISIKDDKENIVGQISLTTDEFEEVVRDWKTLLKHHGLAKLRFNAV